MIESHWGCMVWESDGLLDMTGMIERVPWSHCIQTASHGQAHCEIDCITGTQNYHAWTVQKEKVYNASQHIANIVMYNF